MANKNSFAAEEWTTLRDAPQWTAMAMTVAGASGLFGTLQEAFGITSNLVEGMRSESEIIRALCVKEEIVVAQKSLQEEVKSLPKTDLPALQAQLRAKTTAKLGEAIALLERKGSAEDLAAYRTFVRGLAEKVASAAKEGSFLGFGGERISEAEKEMLARVESALGATRA